MTLFPGSKFQLWPFLFLLGFLIGGEPNSWAFPQRGSDANRCLQCHGNQEPDPPALGEKTPPKLPSQFSMEWQMFEFPPNQRPPWPTLPVSHSSFRGQTFYDWDRKSMTEIYPERCIDIFPSGRDFPCQFLSVRDRTFFITFRSGITADPDSCCLWRKEGFWAPRPDVLFTMRFDQSMGAQGQKTDWWVWEIPLPGPFGYGLSHDRLEPVAFWFPTLSGWVFQRFSHFSSQVPPAQSFEIPKLCRSAIPSCS